MMDGNKRIVLSEKEQDNLDSLELDKLLAEIEGLDVGHDAQAFRDKVLAEIEGLDVDHDAQALSQGSPKVTSLNCVKNFGNSTQVTKPATPHVKSRVCSFDIRGNQSLVESIELESKTAKSKIDDIDISLLGKSHQNNQDKHKGSQILSPKQLNSTTKHENIKDKNLLHSIPSFPSESQSKVQSPLRELVNASKSQNSLSLSNSVKAPYQHETVKLSSVPGIASTLDQGTTLSLADLAKQHKSQIAKRGTSSLGNSMVSQGVNFVLSPLETKFSAQKESSGSCSENKILEKFNRNDTGSLPVAVGSSTSASYLIDLTRVQPGSRSPSFSLSQLAQEYKNSTSPLSAVTTHIVQQKITDSSFTSLVKKSTLENSNSRQCHNSSSGSDISTPVLGQLDGTSLSLQSCLKATKSSGTGIKKSVTAVHNQELEDQPDIFQQDDVELHQMVVNVEDLMSRSSSVGLVLCYIKMRNNLRNVPLKAKTSIKYDKFKCRSQVGNKDLYPEPTYHKLTPFDFSTPSPDDIVKSKQKEAFTRPNKEFDI